MPRHLIVGVSGQDGAYLAEQLVREGEYVVGTSRSSTPSRLPNLVRLGIANSVPVVQSSPGDGATLATVIREHAIDRVCILVQRSSDGMSFEVSVEIDHELVNPALSVLDLLRSKFPDVRLERDSSQP